MAQVSKQATQTKNYSGGTITTIIERFNLPKIKGDVAKFKKELFEDPDYYGEPYTKTVGHKVGKNVRDIESRLFASKAMKELLEDNKKTARENAAMEQFRLLEERRFPQEGELGFIPGKYTVSGEPLPFNKFINTADTYARLRKYDPESYINVMSPEGLTSTLMPSSMVIEINNRTPGTVKLREKADEVLKKLRNTKDLILEKVTYTLDPRNTAMAKKIEKHNADIQAELEDKREMNKNPEAYWFKKNNPYKGHGN